MLKDDYPVSSPHREARAWYEKETICCQCVAGQLMQWERDKNSFSAPSEPQHSIDLQDHWVAVHCDYFKRRVERPDLLQFCGAIRTPKV